MNRIAKRTGILLLLTLLLLGGTGFFLWEFWNQAPSWAVFPGNPHVYSGANIDCGIVTDAEGNKILDLTNGRTYTADSQVTETMVHWVGDRIGFVSAPAIPSHSEALVSYSRLNGLYTYSGNHGGVARLTLSSRLQKAAADAMEGYHGTVAVYNYQTGEILCAVSLPGFDPDHAPEITEENEDRFDGIFVNRFTQSTYTPGSIFKTVTTAAMLETFPDWEDLLFYCAGEYEIGTEIVTCEAYHGQQTLEEAMCNSCNCAYAQMAQLLGPEKIAEYVGKLGVTKSVEFDGIRTAVGSFDISSAEENEVAWAAIGQYTDLVNPCSFLQYMGIIAGGGKAAVPYVVDRIAVEGKTTYSAKTTVTSQIISEDTAEILQDFMENNVVSGYGTWSFPDGVTVCAKSGTSQKDGDREANALFCGFLRESRYPLAFVIVVEEGGYGGVTCPPIMGRILGECISYMDGN